MSNFYYKKQTSFFLNCKMLKIVFLILYASRISAYSYFSAGSSRIVGGETASMGQFPHQVGLFLIDYSQRTYLCGGSIINENWILTAGHCTSKWVKLYKFIFRYENCIYNISVCKKQWS